MQQLSNNTSNTAVALMTRLGHGKPRLTKRPSWTRVFVGSHAAAYIFRPVRFCQLNPTDKPRNVTHTGRTNTHYMHAVGICTGNQCAVLIPCQECV